VYFAEAIDGNVEGAADEMAMEEGAADEMAMEEGATDEVATEEINGNTSMSFDSVGSETRSLVLSRVGVS
jgi:hypothetical protein